MTTRLAPSAKAATCGSHINFNVKKFRPAERVLFTATDDGAFLIGTIEAFTDMSGNWFTVAPEESPARPVVFVRNIRGRVPAEADSATVLRDLAGIPVPAPGPTAFEAAKAAIEAVLRRHGVE